MNTLDRAFLRAFREDARTGQSGKCAYCRDPISAGENTADHIKPRARHGLDKRENIAAACRHCNSLKGKTPVGQFRNQIRRKPTHGSSMALWMAWSRRRINLAVERFERNLFRATGRAA